MSILSTQEFSTPFVLMNDDGFYFESTVVVGIGQSI